MSAKMILQTFCSPVRKRGRFDYRHFYHLCKRSSFSSECVLKLTDLQIKRLLCDLTYKFINWGFALGRS